MSEESRRPIVIKRKKQSSEQPHGAWKIAYADFMTAMMAFFLVMWLIGGLSDAQLKEVSKYFRTPLKVALVGGDQSSASNSAIPGGGDDPIHSDGHKALTEPDAHNYDPDDDRLERLKRRLERAIERDPALNDMSSRINIDIVSDGLRIQIFDSERRPMFKLGSAEIAPYVRQLLRKIGPRLDSVPNRVTLIGHTDDLRFATGADTYSNWELSTDRANAARRELVRGGMDAHKVLRVVGVAATHQLPGDAPDAAVNRRISIMVLSQKAKRRAEAQGRESQPAPGHAKPSTDPALQAFMKARVGWPRPIPASLTVSDSAAAHAQRVALAGTPLSEP